MGLFDSYLFDPATYGGSGGLLGPALAKLKAEMPDGGYRQMGDYMMPVFGQPQQQQPQQAAIPQNAQPTQGYLPPQPQTQTPGFGDRLIAGLGGFTNAGGPLQAVGNLVTGLATGQRQDPAGIMLQQQAASEQALSQAGVPAPLARAAALNPEILKTIGPAYFDTKPQLQETGTDPITGQKTFGVYRPNQGTLTPVGGSGGQPSAGGQGSLDGFQKALAAGVKGEELLQHLPGGMAQTVKAMIDGRMPPPSTVAMRSPATLALINAANAIDPSFDATTWKARNTFSTQFGSAAPSSVGGQKTLMGTSLGHLSELAQTASELGNWDTPIAAVGQGINAVRGLTTDQAAKINKLNEQAARFSGEVGKLYSGSAGGGVHEREDTRARFGGYKTSAELAAALEASRDLITSKLQALESQKNEIFGEGGGAKYDFLGKEGRAAIERIDTAIAKLRNGQSQAAAPAGAPKAGVVEGGYRFKGGNPADKANWEKVQ